jgi:hypothetical protein
MWERVGEIAIVFGLLWIWSAYYLRFVDRDEGDSFRGRKSQYSASKQDGNCPRDARDAPPHQPKSED